MNRRLKALTVALGLLAATGCANTAGTVDGITCITARAYQPTYSQNDTPETQEGVETWGDVVDELCP